MSVFRRRFLLSSGMVLIAAVCCLSTIRGKEDPSAAANNDRKLYADKVHQTYNFVFGADDISSPGNAAVEGNDFLPASAFPDAEYCGHCHQEAYHQWRQALHSNSFRTPFYRTSVNILIRDQGHRVRAALRQLP